MKNLLLFLDLLRPDRRKNKKNSMPIGIFLRILFFANLGRILLKHGGRTNVRLTSEKPREVKNRRCLRKTIQEHNKTYTGGFFFGGGEGADEVSASVGYCSMGLFG
jgi:hypothetical protein